MVDTLGGALLGKLVVFAQERRQLERLEMMREQQLRRVAHDVAPPEQGQIGLGRGHRHPCPRQVGIDRQVEPRWPTLDPAQHQMLDRVKADRAAGDGLFDGGQNVLGPKYLEQPQDLDELAFAALGHARLDQAPQRGEFLGQVPADQRRRLVESADLLFEQGQVMQRVEDEVLALVGARMTRDHLGPAADHHLVDVAADQNLAVTIGGRHRIVGAAIAHQRQRADPARLLLAGIVGRRRQLMERRQIPHQPFANRLLVTAQAITEPAATPLEQLLVQRRKARRPRHRHQQVAARPADQSLNFAFVVAFAGRPNRSANK